jgi:hypothetical protein
MTIWNVCSHGLRGRAMDKLATATLVAGVHPYRRPQDPNYDCDSVRIAHDDTAITRALAAKGGIARRPIAHAVRT